MVRRTLFLCALAACNWTKFDDLANSTWVHSQQRPGVGSSNYAVALIPATADVTGGRLGVLGSSAATYSLLAYDAHGGTKVDGTAIQLAADPTNGIPELPPQPIVADDGAGTIAVAAPGAQNIAVLAGPGDAPGQSSIGTGMVPTAATFAGASLVVAAESKLFELDPASPATIKMCTLLDDTAAPVSGTAALAADASHIYAWTTTGTLYAYARALGTPSCAPVATIFTSPSFAPAAGAHIYLVAGTNFGVLAGVAGDGSKGNVYLVDIMGTKQAGTPTISTDPFASSAFGALGMAGTPFLALGFPDRTVDGVTCGQVELHAFANTSLNIAADELLNDDQPTSGQEFGRALAVMRFNDAGTLAVAANNEVFAYYKTSQYDDSPLK
jgi:hypothetical protein